jgi:riboflavin biosynthesis pyrimidine reductase
VEVQAVVARLHDLGVRTLLVEGGAEIHKSFLEDSLADEFRLSVSPNFLGIDRRRNLPANLREICGYIDKGFYLESVEKLGASCVHNYRALA